MDVKSLLYRLTSLFLIMSLMGWKKVETPSEQMLNYCQLFQKIQVDVREQTVSPDSAARAFQEVMRKIQQQLTHPDSCRSEQQSTAFVYPLRGYQPKYSIGGGGRGYYNKGFNLFDMEVKSGHPAHDLFIRDGNQDNLDDRMCLPVDLLAISSGIVLATETNWQPESELRGGNFIWVYDPCLNGLFYYAHNSRVVVEPGQWVKAGEKIGEVGRTGFNAYKERSPTHLHLMFLRLDADFLPEPENTIDWLRNAETREW
ncbi:M23 family metallopeptidase [Arundinibacter roseus]|uniref:M23 family metallopeptidase n=1 Tax=Arundinibacter roseus TaxID=2070510 RepID=A0A4R4K8L8_9BACT|nr:M23 family metallopeptidase [Arundinibacter roseus]TDB63978.1 M23 family metallopeptidase [Arundinibacter roseus]